MDGFGGNIGGGLEKTERRDTRDVIRIFWLEDDLEGFEFCINVLIH